MLWRPQLLCSRKCFVYTPHFQGLNWLWKDERKLELDCQISGKLDQNLILTPDLVLTHFLLPTCCSDPPAVKLNWCPAQVEYKPRATPSVTAPFGLTHLPLLTCFRLPLSNLNSSLCKESEIKQRKAVTWFSHEGGPHSPSWSWS